MLDYNDYYNENLEPKSCFNNALVNLLSYCNKNDLDAKNELLNWYLSIDRVLINRAEGDLNSIEEKRLNFLFTMQEELQKIFASYWINEQLEKRNNN